MIMGLRRKMKTRAKMGALILGMYEEKKREVENIEQLRKNMGVSFNSLKENLGFLIVKHNTGGHRSKIVLDKKYDKAILTTVETFGRMRAMSEGEQKICQLVFISLMQNGD